MRFASKKYKYNWMVFTLFCLMAGGTVSVFLGQDANWDLLNYHLYNPFAFLNNRMEKDVFAAGIQTYFNPLLDLPYYLLSMGILSEHPRTLAFLNGLPYGVLIFLVFLITRSLISTLVSNPYTASMIGFFATLFGVTGSASISQVGTTFNEVTVAVFVLSGVAVMIVFADASPGAGRWTHLAAGMMFGAAAGLKLTAAIYAPAAAIAIFLTGSWKESALSAAHGDLKTVLNIGKTGFPMFKTVFKSPWAALDNWTDDRFKPKFLWQAIFYPFYWISGSKMTVAEPKFTDPRFAVAFFSFWGIIFGKIFERIRSRKEGSSVSDRQNAQNLPAEKSQKLKFLFLFLLVGYVIWESVFSILRYAVAIESLLGIVVAVFLICQIKKHFGNKGFIIVSFVVAVGVTSLTTYPVWGRAAYSDRVFHFTRISLEKNPLVLLFSKPIAYSAPFIARDHPDVKFIGMNYDFLINADFKIGKIVSDRISSHTGPVYLVIMPRDVENAKGILAKYNLTLLNDNFSTLSSNIGGELYLFRLAKG